MGRVRRYVISASVDPRSSGSYLKETLVVNRNRRLLLGSHHYLFESKSPPSTLSMASSLSPKNTYQSTGTLGTFSRVYLVERHSSTADCSHPWTVCGVFQCDALEPCILNQESPGDRWAIALSDGSPTLGEELVRVSDRRRTCPPIPTPGKLKLYLISPDPTRLLVRVGNGFDG